MGVTSIWCRLCFVLLMRACAMHSRAQSARHLARWAFSASKLAGALPCCHAVPIMQGVSYRGKLELDVCVRAADALPGGASVSVARSFGQLPIMLQSRLCHLRGRSRAQLVALKEEPDEFGGIFICNGIERIIRMLIQQRRHYIMAMNRGAYRKRGANYSPYATLIRCVCRGMLHAWPPMQGGRRARRSIDIGDSPQFTCILACPAFCAV